MTSGNSWWWRKAAMGMVLAAGLVLGMGLGMAQTTAAADKLLQDAIAVMQRGDYREAEFALREVRAKYPLDGRSGLFLMAVVAQQGRTQEALKIGREYAPLLARSGPYHLQMGQLLLRLNLPQEALQEVNAALGLADSAETQAMVRDTLGGVYMQMERVDEAIAEYRKAKALTGRPWMPLALALGAKGEHAESMREYRAVLQVNPNNVVAMNNLAYGIAEHGGNLDEALELALRAMEVGRGNAAFVDTLGWVYFKKGMLVEAEKTLVDAIHEEGGARPALLGHLAAVLDGRAVWSAERKELRTLLGGPVTSDDLLRIKVLLRKISPR